MADDVTGGVVKVIELVGSSAESFDDAVPVSYTHLTLPTTPYV